MSALHWTAQNILLYNSMAALPSGLSAEEHEARRAAIRAQMAAIAVKGRASDRAAAALPAIVAPVAATKPTPPAVIAPTPSSFVPAIPKIVAVLPADPGVIEQRETQRIAAEVSRISLNAGLDSPPISAEVRRIADNARGISRPESSRHDA